MLFHRKAKKKEVDLPKAAIEEPVAPLPIKTENYIYNTEFWTLASYRKIEGFDECNYDGKKKQSREEREALLAQIRALLSVLEKSWDPYHRLTESRKSCARACFSSKDSDIERMLLCPLTQRQQATAVIVLLELQNHNYDRAYAEFTDCVDNYGFAGGTDKCMQTVVSASEYVLYTILLEAMENSLRKELEVGSRFPFVGGCLCEQ